MFPSGSVALVMVAHLSHAVPSATCPILRENYREIESRLMSSLVHLVRCLMKADFARAMRGYASRPAKGECPWPNTVRERMRNKIRSIAINRSTISQRDAASLQPIRALPERPSLRTQLTLLPRRVSV